jgi:hypothetical protein
VKLTLFPSKEKAPDRHDVYPELSPSKQEEDLGRCLFEQLERLDPCDGRKWADLDGAERDIYLLAIVATIKMRPNDVLRILSDDCAIDRGSEVRE